MKLRDLANKLGKPFEGDGDTEIEVCSSIKNAAKGSLVYLENARLLPAVEQSRASAVISPPDIGVKMARIIAERPVLAFASAVSILHPEKKTSGKTHPSSVIDGSASIGKGCDLGPFSSVGAGSVLGDNVTLHPGVAVGENVVIGDGCVIHPNVVVYSGTRIGDGTVIQAGCVIGGDGFRFITEKNGKQAKFPHIGIVRIGNNVEIGANSCVDRAVLDETVIGDGVKMDNLVQVGHNCEIGENTLIAGCTGISGSVKIGKNVIIGGQVGIKDHVSIADNVVIAAKSGVISDLDKPGIYCGMPAVPIAEWRKQAAAVSRGPETLKRLSKLEKS